MNCYFLFLLQFYNNRFHNAKARNFFSEAIKIIFEIGKRLFYSAFTVLLKFDFNFSYRLKMFSLILNMHTIYKMILFLVFLEIEFLFLIYFKWIYS